MQIINTDEGRKMEELTEKLKDHKWRLNNLYYIRDERGMKVRFKLNEAQEWLIDNMWYMTLVVKARQLGVTTFYTIFYLDQVLFSENKIAGIIAHKEEDMKKIFRNKILFALDNLEPWMKRYIGEPSISTANELVFNNGGNIFVALSTRSNTPNFLHVSEYGYICAHTPDKADEILHGAINSVHAGQMVSIESTAEGREGHYYRLAMLAERKRKEGRQLTPLDFKIFFFPWWWDLRYTLPDKVMQTKEDKEYFDMLQTKHGIKLSEGQKAWYTKKKETVGEGIWAQYPSTLDEAFAVTLEGAYYSKEMARVYQDRRIGFFPIDPLFDVNIAWDLGMNDQNILIFYQEIGPEIRFVDAYSNSGYGLEHYVNYIKAKGYRLGRNILPHDVAVRDLSTGISREQFLWDLGMRNTYVVPKGGIQDGIEKTRQLFSRFRFNEETTKGLTDSLHNYRRDFDKGNGVWKSTPRHDESSHYCFSGDTKVLMADGSEKEISKIVIGDKVKTPLGEANVLGSEKTGMCNVVDFHGLKVTKNHPFFTQRGFVPLDSVRTSDTIIRCEKKILLSTESFSEDILMQKEIQKENITKLFHLVRRVQESSGSIDTFGKNIMAQYLVVPLSTIKTIIKVITIYLILNLLWITPNIGKHTIVKKVQKLGKGLSSLRLLKPQSGIGLKKGGSGTANTVKEHGLIGSQQNSLVGCVGEYSKHSHQTEQNGVLLSVNHLQEVQKKMDVYNISTEHGMYIVGDGFIVSNCDAVRTLAMSYQETLLIEGTDGLNVQSFFK